jgi:hypothetical protein
MALKENPQAMRLCLERLLPVRSAPPVRFRLPDLDTATGLDQAATQLLQAAARGQLTPAETKEVAAVLEGKRRIVETRELETRIQALESHVPPARK